VVNWTQSDVMMSVSSSLIAASSESSKLRLPSVVIARSNVTWLAKRTTATTQ
jgi:hypothetical protein